MPTPLKMITLMPAMVKLRSKPHNNGNNALWNSFVLVGMDSVAKYFFLLCS